MYLVVQAVASTSKGEIAVNYSRHPHPHTKKIRSVIVTSYLRLLIAYFSLLSIRMELLEENWLYFIQFSDKATKVTHNNFINGVTNLSKFNGHIKRG